MSDLETRKLKPKLYCIRLKDGGCDRKKCTALKLKRLNLLTVITKITGRLKNAILLNPLSQKVISEKDRKRVLSNGIIVLDCSWRSITRIKSFKTVNTRRLPPLIAVNPVNFGKWEKLSSAEAISAALYIVKFKDYAKLILSKFSWGNEFFNVNYELKDKDKKK